MGAAPPRRPHIDKPGADMARAEILQRLVTITRTLESQLNGLRVSCDDERARLKDTLERSELLSGLIRDRDLRTGPPVQAEADMERLGRERAAASANIEQIQRSMGRILPVLGPYREVSKAVLTAAKVGAEEFASVALPQIEIVDDGDPRRAALDEVQKAIARVDEEADAVREAPVPADDAAARVMQALDDERTIARVQLSYFAGSSAGRVPTASFGLLDLVLGPGELEKRLRAYFAASMPGKGLPLASRGPMLAKLEKQRTALLEREERETCALEANGLVVVRRRDVDPKLLLSVWESLA
jgi:dipeptidyl aminopeptidase/acylaminoacyl peptidase